MIAKLEIFESGCFETEKSFYISDSEYISFFEKCCIELLSLQNIGKAFFVEIDNDKKTIHWAEQEQNKWNYDLSFSERNVNLKNTLYFIFDDYKDVDNIINLFPSLKENF